MTDTQLRAPETGKDDGYTRLMLAALRVARAKLKLILLEIDDIGIELREGRITPADALGRCIDNRIDCLFPGKGDG